MEPTIIATDHDYEMRVYSYDATLFAAKPKWATASIVFKDTHPAMIGDVVMVDPHEVSGHIYAKNLKSDPFHTPFWFATEADALKAAESVKGLALVDAVGKVEMARASSARISRAAK